MSNDTIITVQSGYMLQQSKADPFSKAVALLFQKSLNESYLEKWLQAREEIAYLQYQIYALQSRPPLCTNCTQRPTLTIPPSGFAIDAGPLESPV